MLQKHVNNLLYIYQIIEITHEKNKKRNLHLYENSCLKMRINSKERN